ncbi:unnamed protein product [Caenorhabditis angaria]|uniref:Transmembrane protein 134 n=1 Tax=Caenorhabditis angaria TaxID=860376 RepID=A0A9P1MXN3_9PELO|nr:unnamed protein product [Caenorhabditis angaria]
MPTISGHQRNVSQGQHLILDRTESDDDEMLNADKKHAATSQQQQGHETSIQMDQDNEPVYGTGGVFPGSSPPYTPSRPQDNSQSGLCSPQIRSNVKVILGSIVLTAVGIVIFIVGIFTFLNPDDGMQHWVFFFAGLVCFIPGSYHVHYVLCTICGRPGYSFDKLPTFNR